MLSPWLNLFPLFLIVFVAGSAPAPAVTQFLADPYEMSLWKSNQWFPTGSALLDPRSQGVFLTKKGDVGDQRGGIWNPTPFPYTGGFNITVQSRISYSNNDYKKTNAKGMAIWLVEKPPGANLGVLGDVYGSHDRFKGLGIVFDTIDDDNHRNNPSISAHYLDGTKSYPHHNDGLGSQLSGCVADYRRMDNAVTTQIVYDGERLSVYVNLEKAGLRKCLNVPLVMDLNRDLFLGVTAETINNDLPPETHEIKLFNINGVVAPGQQPRYQSPSATQEQVQTPKAATYQASTPTYQSQPTAATYQAPPSVPTYKSPPASTTSQSGTDVALHDKIDQLVHAASTSVLNSGQAGEALKEVQTNVLQKLHQSTNNIVQQMRRVDQSLSAHVQSSSAQIDAIKKLLDSTKGSVDAGRVDGERRANAADAQLDKMQKDFQDVVDMVGRLQRSVQQQISREIGKGTARLSAAATRDSGGFGGVWLYLVLFQIVFVAFLLYRHVTNKKLDKLL